MAKKIALEGIRMVFKNFAGKESKFNRAGNRNFCIVLNDPELVRSLREDGWNIKDFKTPDDEGNVNSYLPVSVSYSIRPPEVYMYSGNTVTMLNEDTIGTLDYAEVENVDVILNPYEWSVNGKTGVKAYLRSMRVVLEEDAFANKYSKYAATGTDDDLPF